MNFNKRPGRLIEALRYTCSDVVGRSQRRTVNVQSFNDIMSQRQNYNVTERLNSKFNSQYTMLYWRCCNVEIATSVSQRLDNVNTTTSNVVKTLPQRWIVSSPQQYPVDVVTATLIQCLKFILATSNSQRLLDVDITTLHQRCVSFAKNLKCGLFKVVW